MALTLQAYFLQYRYANRVDKRNHIRERWIGRAPQDRASRAVGRTATDYSSRVYLLKQWQILGRGITEAIKTDSPADALYCVNNAPAVGNRDWLERLQVMFPTDSFMKCHDCNTLEMYDDGYSAYDGDYRVCSSCRDSNYHYSDRRDMLVSDDDTEDEDEEENERNGIIGDYHSSKRRLGHIPSAYDRRNTRVLVGLELEMEINHDYNRYDKAEELLIGLGQYQQKRGDTYQSHQYALCENDGSLNDGFEMVTGYTGLDVHAQQLAFFKNRFIGAKSHNTSTCGLHVHVCKAGMSLLHASKLVLFINDSANYELVKAIARRTESTYSQFKDKKTDKSWVKDAVLRVRPRANDDPEDLARNKEYRKENALCCLNSSRYEALNFNNTNTVEFRLFKGTLKYETIMACLEFAFISWFFARDTSQTQLTTANFLQYICLENNRRDTRFLRAYLESKNFVLPFKAKPDSRQQTATSNQPTTTNEEF